MSGPSVFAALLGLDQPGDLPFDLLQTDRLKKAAAFWLGSKAGYKLRKAELPVALKPVLRDPEAIRAGLDRLTEAERQVLAVCKAYGGAVSGALLYSELISRGLQAATDPARTAWQARREAGPVFTLIDKLALVPLPEAGYSRYSRYDFYEYQYGYRSGFPDVAVPPGLLPAVEPAAAVPWPVPKPLPEPPARYRRSAAAAVLELGIVAQALEQLGSWKVNRGGSLPKSTQARLEKLLTVESDNDLRPPDAASLYYELLRGDGVAAVEADVAAVDPARLEQFRARTTRQQGRALVHAWMQARLWQDGLGVVPDRDSDHDPVRIPPAELRRARETLVWALCRLALGPPAWVGLEAFLTQIRDSLGHRMSYGFWFAYAWAPEFKQARGRDEIPVGRGREIAFWLTSEGVWAANALVSTLAFLGWVERGGDPKAPAFRLTDAGRAVFSGAEDDAGPRKADRFLAVQPNHDVLVYLEEADPSQIWALARMARRTSAGNDPVQTFVLTPESVYQGLESGLTAEQMREFLAGASKTGLPNNVAHSLNEWGRKRESLVLRSGVTLLAAPAGREDRLPTLAAGRRVGDQFLLLPPTDRVAFKAKKRDHAQFAPPGWTVDETGAARPDAAADMVTRARLALLAEDGKITAAAVRRARDRGVTAEQALEWLREQHVGPFPPIVETAVRNWFSAGRAALASVLVLQVPQPQACAAILAADRFRPYFLSHVPPNFFVVRPDQKKALTAALRDLGFVLDDEVPFAPLPGAAPAEAVGPAAEEAASAQPRKRGRPRR